MQKQWQRSALDHSSCIRVKPGLCGARQATGDYNGIYARLAYELRGLFLLHTHTRVRLPPPYLPSFFVFSIYFAPPLQTPLPVRVSPIQARLSVQLREVAEASSWPNCSATYSARMHVLWVHVSVNFGNRYLDGLFAIFHYACEHRATFRVCERKRGRERLWNVARVNGKEGEWNIYIYMYMYISVTFYGAKFNNHRRIMMNACDD